MSSKVYPVAYIYKLSNGDESLVYYGSTQNIKQRIQNHIYAYNKYIGGAKMNYAAFQVLACKDYKFEVMETLVNISKEDLLKKESAYIQSNLCVNQMKIYGDKTKSQQERKRKQYEKHKDKLLKKSSDYYVQNKDTLREKAAEKINCACGSSVRRDHLSSHKKTKKHQAYEASKTNNISINNFTTVNIYNN
jgi:hypothetical protein